MSILVDKSTRVIVQGLTGREGSFHAQQMIDYGTKITRRWRTFLRHLPLTRFSKGWTPGYRW
jgi:hypothetical protein